MNMTLIAYYQKGRLQGPVWHLLEENGYLISDNLESSGTSLYIYPGTVFENHRKKSHSTLRAKRATFTF